MGLEVMQLILHGALSCGFASFHHNICGNMCYIPTVFPNSILMLPYVFSLHEDAL